MKDPSSTTRPSGSKPVDYIRRTKERYDALGYPPYRWVHNEDPPPFSPFSKALPEARIGLIASGGIYLEGQIAFHHRDDASFRLIPENTAGNDLRITHFAYDTGDARIDPGVVFPLARLRDLAREGVIGGLAANACTFMGGIYSSRKVRDALAPALADRMQAESVDAVMLVPA
ncbi:glycine/sarcosine/betaine reductase selenoprotein B family protein [Thioalkalivibrio sp. HK1]|uniref:glycine/sarcosine/betaine reductase selenoprotein B family protein n=1 Tax=Thioalkalivibrio sp. HK1 TaxID=1469245 RepID=UPI00046EB529|nr:glycine/sarcosine/betaine reductase selenoprotein B family protein [Thioalkalivibrio sp. HK1]